MIIGSVALMLLLVVALTFTGCANATIFSGSSNNLNHTFNNRTWTITATSVSGNLRRNFDINADGLELFRVRSTNTQGTIELVLTQGDVTRRVDITDGFLQEQSIDMSEFNSDSRINVRLNFSSARNVNTIISWRA